MWAELTCYLRYMRLRDIRMEDDNHKIWMEREDAKREEKREAKLIMARMEEERILERNFAREQNQSMMVMMMALVNGGSAGKQIHRCRKI